ncbi:MAG: hypothetical protein JXQ99_04775 [Hyphomicrobiaceae bacterium]
MYQKILAPVDVNQLDKANVMLETARKLGGDETQIILAHIMEAIPTYIAIQIPSDYADAAKKEVHGDAGDAEERTPQPKIKNEY